MGNLITSDDITILGEKYERGRVVGRGSYGKVSAILHKASEKWKVIKEIHKSILLEKQELEVAVNERKILSHLQGCSFVPKLFASFQNDQQLQLLLEFYEGGELEFHLDTKGYFLEEEVKHIMAHLTLGLEEMHAAGVMHRDLKLSNILLDDHGFTFINDFGLALLYDPFKKETEEKDSEYTPEEKPPEISNNPETPGKTEFEKNPKKKNLMDPISSTTNLTKPGSLVFDPNPNKLVVGTIPYIPPELLLGDAHDEKVDWWSLGIIGYELAHGVTPDQIHFNPMAAIEEELEINQPKYYTPTEKDKKLFREWDWINPRFPLGLTTVEEDIVLLKRVQHFDRGLELYEKEGLRPRGRIIFHLKDIPEGGLFFTARGTSVERSRGIVLVGDVKIPI